MKLNLLSLSLALTASVVGLTTTGCQTEHGVYEPQNMTKFDTENKAKFVLMDGGAAKSITCSSLQEGTTADGRLAIAANIRNRENRRIQVQVNCEFKDEQGFVVDSTPWQTLILTENGQETQRFEAMNEKAKRYTVRVREAR